MKNLTTMQYLLLGAVTLIVIAIFVALSNVIYQKLTSKKIMLDKNLEQRVVTGTLQKVVFSGGCFWCTEASYAPEYGVESAVSGFFGGNTANPTYQDHGDHKEAVQVYFNNASTSYKKLLVNYWKHIDPTQNNGQFADIGNSYKTAIYYFTDEQKMLAEESKKVLEDSKKFGDKKIVVEILDGRNFEFFPAEEYHQDYAEKNPVRYEYYKNGSGRTDFVKNNWKNDNTFKNFLEDSEKVVTASPLWETFTQEIKTKRIAELTPMQKKVTQEEGTETPFGNIYDKNLEKGIYVDVVSGEPLYSSSDKFDSGTGWPSFVKPISDSVLNLKTDNYLIYSRTEVRSKIADSHLGHLFDDGPRERGGKRYCMNSAALNFIPLVEMESKGYGEYIKFIK